MPKIRHDLRYRETKTRVFLNHRRLTNKGKLMSITSFLTETQPELHVPQKFFEGLHEKDRATLQGVIVNYKVALFGVQAGLHAMVAALVTIESIIPDKFKDFAEEVLEIDMRTVRRWRQAVGTYNELFSGADGVRLEYASLIRQDALLRLTYADQDVKDVVVKLVEDGQKVDGRDVEEIVNKFREENEELKDVLQRERNEKAAQNKKHLEEMKNVRASLSTKFQEVESLRKMVSFHMDHEKELEKDRAEVSEQIRKLQAELVHLKATPQIREVPVEVIPKEYENIDAAIRSVERKLAGLEEQLSGMTIERDNLQEQIAELERVVNDPRRGMQMVSELSDRSDAFVKDLNFYIFETEGMRNKKENSLLEKIGAQFAKIGDQLKRLAKTSA